MSMRPNIADFCWGYAIGVAALRIRCDNLGNSLSILAKSEFSELWNKKNPVIASDHTRLLRVPIVPQWIIERHADLVSEVAISLAP